MISSKGSSVLSRSRLRGSSLIERRAEYSTILDCHTAILVLEG
jgi:hypothetical protein